MIAFQVFKNPKPSPNGNFTSLTVVYDEKGDIVEAWKEQTSAPQAPNKLRSELPELPTIRVTATELRELYKSCKGEKESF